MRVGSGGQTASAAAGPEAVEGGQWETAGD